MKYFLLLTLLSLPAMAQRLIKPHLDLEMTTEEYQQLLKQHEKILEESDPEVEAAIAMGERLSKWINKVNEGRSPEQAIRLSSAATQAGVPIETPNVYNPKIIGEKTAKIMSELPGSMKAVVTTTTELPGTIDLDDETFIKHARLLNLNYQKAVRYKVLWQYRYEYQAGAAEDVRGYYYLTKNNFNETTLRDVNLIPEAQRPLVKAALTQMCSMSAFFSCVGKVEKAFANNDLVSIYNSYYSKAQKIWNTFFIIPPKSSRKDVVWTATTLTVPFNTPAVAKFKPYLQDNIEDEFKWQGWNLRLNFGTFANGPVLIFKAGAVPHVNGLGGNEITMDANEPIEEYSSQWTIRHEFGHVLGLPDCYHEFYDKNLKAFVNYQLDITDLMCSRTGKMKERIFKELEKAYKK